jgi:hypothetical protein
VSNRVLNLDFIEHSPVIECHEESVPNGPLRRVVIFYAKTLFFNTKDFSTKSVNARVGGGRIGAGGSEG